MRWDYFTWTQLPVLGEERIGASTSSKSVRQKKQVLQSTDSRENIMAQVKIKTEKMSILDNPEASSEPVRVKVEKPEIAEMPAPKLPLRKRKVAQKTSVGLPKRTTRTKKKTETDTNTEVCFRRLHIYLYFFLRCLFLILLLLFIIPLSSSFKII